MTATLIDGAAIAAAILDEAARDVRALRDEGVRPGLAAVLVGDDPASHVYVRNKIKACARVGVESRVFTLSSSSTHRDLLDLVRSLNRDDAFHGILVQLPLPPHLDPFPIIEALDPAKDVDGLHPTSMGLLAVGRPSFVPATPAGILRMLLHLGVDPDGKTVVICGRSNIVGKPLALLLSQEVKHANATIILCHTHTHDIASLMRRGDIVVIATGDPTMGEGVPHPPRRRRHRRRHQPRSRRVGEARLPARRRRGLRRGQGSRLDDHARPRRRRPGDRRDAGGQHRTGGAPRGPDLERRRSLLAAFCFTRASARTYNFLTVRRGAVVLSSKRPTEVSPASPAPSPGGNGLGEGKFMTQEPVYVTPQGMTKLQEELDDLRNRRRAEVGRKLHAARDLEVTGDALVDDAVEEQAKIEGRILEIETVLKNAKVVRHDRPTRQAAIGSTVTVQHEDGAEETYTIVGHLEADPRAGRISNESPIGKAILGKRSGEAAQVAAPAGATKIKVLKVA